MGAKISTIVKVEVKNGDALPSNRTHGSSNTGTYFLASGSEFEKILKLIDSSTSFQFDFEKIKEYQVLFKEFFWKYSERYEDKLKNFDNYCSNVLSSCVNYEIKLKVRNNDSRYFLRFENNDDFVVNSFRHILYGDITCIVLEFYNNICKIYPIVSNYNYFDEFSTEKCEAF